MNCIEKEAIRQQRETFDQHKHQDRLWFALRLVMGYSSVVLLLSILVLCAEILIYTRHYPEFVVRAASVTLFADVIGLIFSVWKVALSPSAYSRLHPVTSRPGSHDDWGR